MSLPPPTHLFLFPPFDPSVGSAGSSVLTFPINPALLAVCQPTFCPRTAPSEYPFICDELYIIYNYSSRYIYYFVPFQSFFHIFVHRTGSSKFYQNRAAARFCPVRAAARRNNKKSPCLPARGAFLSLVIPHRPRRSGILLCTTGYCLPAQPPPCRGWGHPSAAAYPARAVLSCSGYRTRPAPAPP